MKHDPVIVIGMHRAGTSMLVSVLRELGVFLGWSVEENGEARLFLALNEWMLAQAGSRWDSPVELPEALTARFVRVARRHLSGMGRYLYLGPRLSWRCPRLESLPVPWGWKDPRNTLTLGVWLRLFADGRVLHIHRHPVDVAESLRQRAVREIRSNRRRLRRWLSEATLLRTPVYCQSTRVLDLDWGVALWTTYVQQALDWCGRLGDRAHSCSYESLVQNPEIEIDSIARFLEIRPARSQLEAAVARIRRDRCLAYSSDPGLRALHRKIVDEPLVQRLGYVSTGPT